MLRSPPPRHSLASEYGPRAPQMSYPGVRPARSQAPGDSHVHARAAYAQVFGSLGPSARCVVQGGEMTPWRKCRNSQKKKKKCKPDAGDLGWDTGGHTQFSIRRPRVHGCLNVGHTTAATPPCWRGAFSTEKPELSENLVPPLKTSCAALNE